MEPNKPRSVKTIGTLITAISGFIIFGNGMGLLGYLFISSDTHADSVPFFFPYYIELCLTMTMLGVFFLIGGLFIQKYLLWANRLVTITSGLLIIIMWSLFITLSATQGETDSISKLFPMAVALFVSIPLVLVIRYLNQRDIKKYFE